MKNDIFESLIQSLPDIVYKIDSDGYFTFINNSISTLGYEIEELIGKQYSIIIHPDDIKSIQSSMILPDFKGKITDTDNAPKLFDERRTGERITKNLKVKLLPKGYNNKTQFPTGEIISSGLYDRQKNFLGTIGIIKDINKLIRTEKALILAEKHYRTIINNSSDIITILSPDGTILYKNKSIEINLGYKAFDLIGENELEFTHIKDKDKLNKILKEELKFSDSIYYIEHRYLHKDGSYRFFESSLKQIFDNKNEIATIIMYSRDITQRKEYEENLISLREKEILLKEIHHRVKNNMQIISSLLRLQSSKTKSRKTKELLMESQNRVSAMSLVHELLYMSDNLEQVDFKRYLQDISSLLFHTYNINAASIQIKSEVEDVHINIDKAIPCALIISELVSNSLKHAFPKTKKGEIKISLNKSKKGNYALTISDNGVGLPEGLDYKNTDSLGLELVNALTRQLGGNIKLVKATGTKFKITFPF